MNFKDLYKKGLQYLKEEKYLLAKDSFLDALKIKHDDIYSLNRLAHIYSVLEDNEKAIETLTKILDIQREDLYANYQMGNILFEKEEFDLAEKFLLKALKINPLDGYCKNSLALLYRNSDRLEKAIEILKENITEHPDDPYNYHSIALCYIDKNDYAHAADFCNELIERDAENIQGRLILGQIFEYWGNYIDAKYQYEKVLKADPDNSLAFYNLADLALKEAGNLDRFKLFILLGESRSGEHDIGVFKEVLIIKSQEKLEEALCKFKILVEKSPDSEAYLNSLALADLLKGDFKLAEDKFKHSLNLESHNPFAHYNLGFLSLVNNQLDLAIVHLEEACAQDPEDLYSYNFLGFLMIFRGFYEKANKCFYKALELSRTLYSIEDAYSNFGLAIICKIGQDQDGAEEFLRTIIKEHKNSPIAERAARYLSRGL
ncbi:tetratricopeptide repeat protein [Candidatus Riflebacteria bacterium]